MPARTTIRNHNANGPRGDGEFRQVIDATRLGPGLHFLTIRVYCHQPADSPVPSTYSVRLVNVDFRPA